VTAAELRTIYWPRRFAATLLARGSLLGSLVCIAVAMAFSTVAAYRIAQTVRFEELVFGPGRSPAIDALLNTIGRDRTAVVVYLFERSFDLLIIASALTPLFFWLLGSSAVHAAARLQGVRGRLYLPILLLFAYAALAYEVPVATATILLGAGPGPGESLSGAISLVMLLWFAAVAYRGIELHYGVSGGRALMIFVIAIVLFYLLPAALIIAAIISIVVAAAVLEYF
jgi:hypothetical protein